MIQKSFLKGRFVLIANSFFVKRLLAMCRFKRKGEKETASAVGNKRQNI